MGRSSKKTFRSGAAFERGKRRRSFKWIAGVFGVVASLILCFLVCAYVVRSSANNGNLADHQHPEGEHGGAIAGFGAEHYHAEVVVQGEKMRLFLLGSDRSRVLLTSAKVTPAALTPIDSPRIANLLLMPSPALNDPAGKTSQFVAQLPREIRGKAFNLSVPDIVINGHHYGFAVTNVSSRHNEASGRGIEAEDERLYLTAGGKYTEADIRANGRVTASQKYAVFKAKHDVEPLPGDRICPVTHTKANPRCTWIIDGQNYEFCCPPCIDEFVLLAKTDPEKIARPEFYVNAKSSE